MVRQGDGQEGNREEKKKVKDNRGASGVITMEEGNTNQQLI